MLYSRFRSNHQAVDYCFNRVLHVVYHPLYKRSVFQSSCSFMSSVKSMRTIRKRIILRFDCFYMYGLHLPFLYLHVQCRAFYEKLHSAEVSVQLGKRLQKQQVLFQISILWT